MTNYTKQIREKNQRTLIKNAGGKKAFYDNCNSYISDYRSLVLGIQKYILSDPPHVSYYEQYLYLRRTIPSFTDEPYAYVSGAYGKKFGIEVRRGVYVKREKVFQTYIGIMVRDQIKLYEQIRREHPEW